MNKSIPICSEFKNKTEILNKKGVYVQIGKEDGGDEGDKGDKGDRGRLKGSPGHAPAKFGNGDGGGDGGKKGAPKGVSGANAGGTRRR